MEPSPEPATIGQGATKVALISVFIIVFLEANRTVFNCIEWRLLAALGAISLRMEYVRLRLALEIPVIR